MPATGSDRTPPPRRSIRLRLTMMYSSLFLICGAALLGFVYALVDHAVNGQGKVMVFDGPVSGLPPVSQGVPDPNAVKTYVQNQVATQRAGVLNALLVTSGAGLVVMAAVSVLLGWLVAGRALRPVREMTAKAWRLSEANLHQRLAVTGPADELKELGDTFDNLLARLDTAFEAQKRFVANASHELRTPLTLQKAMIEVALADPDADADTLRGVCERVLHAADDQNRLIEALLTLARSHRGLDRREHLDIGTALVAVIAERRAANPVPVRVDSGLRSAVISGDRRLFERLAGNLVDNALRYNVPGGWIGVWTGMDAGRAVLRVVNSGPVIPPESIDTLFQPFQRLVPRAARPDGHGLGLSIVVAIAHAHGAHVTAQTQPMPHGGLAVTIAFPPATPVAVVPATVPRVPRPAALTYAGVAEESPTAR